MQSKAGDDSMHNRNRFIIYRMMLNTSEWGTLGRCKWDGRVLPRRQARQTARAVLAICKAPPTGIDKGGHTWAGACTTSCNTHA